MDDSYESTSEDNTSSECSTDSSDDDKLEPVTVNGEELQLPQGLCEHPDIFFEFFTPSTWNSLSDQSRQHLTRFLPDFPENDAREKSVTLERLFSGEEFRFGSSPLRDFHEHLKAGHYRPDIARMRMMIKKAVRRESRHRYKNFREKVKRNLLESRSKLLELVKSLPPGREPKLTPNGCNGLPQTDSVAYRTKFRYFQELSAIRAKVDESGFSSDENYPEGPPTGLSRKQKRHLNTIRNSHSLSGEKIFISSVASKPTGLDLEKYVTGSYNPFLVSEDGYKVLLQQHKRRKVELFDDAELNVKGIGISDVVNRTKLPYVKKLPSLLQAMSGGKNGGKVRKRSKRDKHMTDNSSQLEATKSNPNTACVNSSNSDVDSDSSSYVTTPSSQMTVKVKSKPQKQSPPKPEPKAELKQEPIDLYFLPKAPDTPKKTNYSQYGKITPATFSDLDGIDMMNLPIDLEDTNIDILELNNKPELMQETHASFLSLIRDIICSTNDHRMTMTVLEERLKAWQENPISPLNDWYSSAENWVDLLQSAISFLSGNFPEQPDDFVPYIEYKPQLDVYQWIGAGRDSDNSLSPLCRYWLDHRNELKQCLQKDVKEEPDVDVADHSQTPPPPRCPTTWTVRKADPEDVKAFQEQERRRYDNPHKAFTYRCNGYESVVGPLKGIYNPSQQQNAKARGHNMLSADRPNFVTILSLVRDATARLPNGEGTRAEICELLKSSQYISSSAPDNVLQSVVSGALDRMHTQFDPCVKYDPKRKIWIYLHRNRSEEDFERLHQQYQGMNRSLKKSTAKSRSPSKAKAKVEKPAGKGKGNNASTANSSQDKPKPAKTKATTSGDTKAANNPNASKQQQQQQSVLIAKKQPVQDKIQVELELPKLETTVELIDSSQQKPLIKEKESEDVHSSSPVHSKPKSNKIQNQNKSVCEKQPQTTVSQPKSVQIVPKLAPEVKIEEQKLPVSIQQQILQTISSQQLQNLKTVTLLRGMQQSTVETSDELFVQTGSPKHELKQPVQQQQPPQKIQSPQQMLIKQHTHKQPQKQQKQPNTSLLGQPQLSTDVVAGKPAIITTSQAPVVAKVLTNAAGQVISVGSLLAHQKQHGTLPQGTTLRVSTSKSGHTNIIQLAPQTPSPRSVPVTQQQFTVSSPNSFLALTQPKLVVASQSTPVTSTVTVTKATVSKQPVKTPAVTKMPTKVAQQLINAKFIAQSLDGQRIVMSPSKAGAIKPVTLNVNTAATAATGSIRMVNTANLNLTHIAGKPVLLANKGGTIQTIQGQNVILQTQAANAGNFIIQNAKEGQQQILGQNVVLAAPQLKQPQQQPVVLSPGVKTGTAQGSGLVRLQTGTGGQPAQRLVLASSNQGGQIVAQQILLPAGFQGTAINIKALQGVKVIPIAQTNKNVQGRQVFARLINPANVVKTTQQGGSGDVVGESPPVTN